MSSSNPNWHGAERNVHGGLYIRGRAHDILRKLQVAEEYNAAAAARGGNVRPNISNIAEKMKVSESFVVKIEGELLAYGSVLSPEEIRTNAIRQRGPGAYTLTDVDCFVLYQLYVEQPYTPQLQGLAVLFHRHRCQYGHNKSFPQKWTSFQRKSSEAKPCSMG